MPRRTRVEEAIKTKQNAENTLTINICVPILKNKIPVEVFIDRDRIEEYHKDKQNAVFTALTASNITERNCNESEKIGVQKLFE